MEIAHKRIGRYEISAELGRGGSGIVYRAFEPLLERHVALKVLAPAAAQPGLAGLLRREAINAARLRHLNIALLYEFGEADGHSFLAMEYIPGRTLRAVLAEGALPIARSLAILGQIGQALDYMHQVGVVHRDVKPGNMMIGPGDHAVLIDFGLAYADDAATAESAMIGTPTYLAPEQAAGAPCCPASDQYALAVVAYELLTGAPPFAGRPPAALIHAHLRELPDPPSERCPRLPAALDAVLGRALAKNPAARYPALADFQAALQGALARPALARLAAPQPLAGGRPWRTLRLAAAGLALLLALQPGRPAAPGSQLDGAAPALDGNPPPALGAPLPEHVVWSYDAGLAGGSALTLAGDTLVTATLDGALVALRTDTGAVRWRLPAAGGAFGAPSAGAGMVFAGNDRGELLALSLASGGPVWRTPVEGDVRLAPTLERDYVIASTSKGYLYVLRAANGEVVWSRPLAPGAQQAVAAGDALLVSAEQTLFCLDLAHGAVAWRFAAASPIATRPVVAGGSVIVGTERGMLHGLSLDSGREEWLYQARAALGGAPAAGGGIVYVADRAGGVTALRQGDGAALWSRQLSPSSLAAPLLTADALLVAAGDGALVALDPQDGRLLSRLALGAGIDTPPLAGDGLVYARAGQIYALGSSPK